jgi:hypothetical protein
MLSGDPGSGKTWVTAGYRRRTQPGKATREPCTILYACAKSEVE